MKIELDLSKMLGPFDLDELILPHLQWDYKGISMVEKYKDISYQSVEPNQHLLDALKVVIEYYSDGDEYEEWLKTLHAEKSTNA
jgi:hypothetical protein